MPDDPEAQFHLAAIKALARLIAMIENDDAERSVDALRALLTVITKPRERHAAERAEALMRALDNA